MSSPQPLSTDSKEHPVPGLEEDPEGAHIVREELRLLSTVLAGLDHDAGSGAAAARGRQLDEARLLELRDEAAVAKPEDLPALFEQMHHLGALREHRGRGAAGSVNRASPYFGHMRLEENVPPADRTARGPGVAATRRRDVLIGARSYVNSGQGIRIVDWRQAPVSRLYYRYAEGDDYEEQLGDRLVEGTVVARRGVSIVAGDLVRVSARQGTFAKGADGRWARVVASVARLETEKKWTARRGTAPEARLGIGADGALRQDKHLPAIAALLDARQFELITRDEAGLVAIQGSAGSGKTTVGIHRAAYLAFRDPKRYPPEGMLVIVPTEALVHYVSRVLPSLGVEGVPVSTFGRFAAQLVARLYPKLPTAINDETPPVVSRAKSHPALLRGIDRIVERVAGEIAARVRSATAKWPGGSLALQAWERSGPADSTPDMRLGVFGQWLAGKRPIAGVEAAAAVPEVTRSALEQLVPRERVHARSVTAIWDELLTSRDAWDGAFAGGGGGAAFAGSPALGPGQLDQVHAWCVRQARIRAEGDRDGEAPTLDTEDWALLLRCWQSLRGPIADPSTAKPVRFAHVFIDEVQDASPIELRVLLDLAGKGSSVTLAGDVAQRMTDDGPAEHGEFEWNALLDGLGLAHTTIEPLRVSYRSTAAIAEFARAVLGPLAHDEAPVTTRQGPPVELFEFVSTGEAVAWLADVLKQQAYDEPEANVAVVARFPQQADLYFEGLCRAEVPNVRRVSQQDFSWEPGVDVTDIRQTKGLEFDEVVLIETTATSYPVTAAARHALYVAATRASHQLWCVTTDTPSKLITAALAGTDFT